jgi:hypothetical protein
MVEPQLGEKARELVGRPRSDATGGGVHQGMDSPDRDRGFVG